MKEALLQLLRDQDSFAAIEYASRQADPLLVVAALDELMRDLYWKQKDLPACVALGRAAAQYAVTNSARLETENPALAVELRGKAKAICYNLASFTWSGWGEEGIRVTPSDEAIGLDAAKANLRLGIELKRGDLALSRAHWMLGAQQISAKYYALAAASFAAAERHAAAANEPGDRLLAGAFACLTEYLKDSNNRERFQKLTDSIGKLVKVKDGNFFADQVAKALDVFCPQRDRKVYSLDGLTPSPDNSGVG